MQLSKGPARFQKMDCNEEIRLPLEVQLWFLEQSGYFLKARLDDRKYEAACVLFERVLCGYIKRELKGKLQVVYSDLIRLLEHIHRWDFVKAACQGCLSICYSVHCSNPC
ncbi:protein unc-80 homolog [Rhopilema esculentum]|uniref:protein unc-80 homolog n=1 Tax=Rhopilema esculentum TaxID=499914 RepID=UPI0031D158E4